MGLTPQEVAKERPPPEVGELNEHIVAAGGATLASYRGPLGSRRVVMAVLPLERVEPTAYQREISEAHAKRLVEVIPKVGRFLDLLIAVRRPDGKGYWTARIEGIPAPPVNLQVRRH